MMIKQADYLCWRYLNRLYAPLEPTAIAEPYRKKHLSATQGEVLYHSFNTLLSEVPWGEQDHFYDLGSGTGRLSAQVFLKTAVQEACGIELIPELYRQSLEIADHIQHELPEFYEKGRKLRFIQGDFLETLPPTATIVFINSICFSQKTLLALGQAIDKTPSIHTLLSLRPLPSLRRLSFVKTILTECTWDSALCYFYQKDRAYSSTTATSSACKPFWPFVTVNSTRCPSSRER